MRLLRLALGLVAIAALVAAAVAFADHPGRVAILWQGWQIETSVAVLAAAALLLALAVAFLFRLFRLILGGPRRMARWRRERRRSAGYRALSQGMVAVAAGEPDEALRHARRAGALLAEPPLTLLLSAQAAQLAGDEDAARKYFTAMLERPETEFLGLRGLIRQAMRAEERGTALALVERARKLRPKARWVAESLYDLEIREGRWEAALGTLAQLVRGRTIPAERGRRQRGVILYEQSRAADAAGDRRQALKQAAQAQQLTPDLAASAAHHARLLLADGQNSAAAKAVERAWRTAPHPALAQLYETIHSTAPPLARLKRFERLAAQNPDADESHLALAEAALAAQLWGEARRHLDKALQAAAAAPPTRRLCLLMARLEEAEHQDLGRVRDWLDRAVAAPPEPRWVCTSCGTESRDWQSLCQSCGAFDRFDWRVPAVPANLPATPPAAGLPAAREVAQ